MEAGRDFGRKIGMVKQFDIIVVGSGFGGAVVACRLAEAGHSVLILERGREWKPEEYPRDPSDAWIWNDSKPEKQNGWIDLRYFGDMTVVQGAAVGGGSLIYANVSVEAEPCIFNNGWPSGITYDLLEPHFETVGNMLNVQELPDNQLTERFKLMREGANKLNHGNRFRKLPLAVTFDSQYSYDQDDPHNENRSVTWKNTQGQAQGTCIHCGNCDIGCRVQAKNTLDLNYLAAARCAGAEIRPNHIVRRLETSKYGYRVCYQQIKGGKLIPGYVEAKKVVLAAGSLGSTELLLRCRDEFWTLPRISPRLGYGWSSNGDFLTPAIYTHKKFRQHADQPSLRRSISLMAAKVAKPSLSKTADFRTSSATLLKSSPTGFRLSVVSSARCSVIWQKAPEDGIRWIGSCRGSAKQLMPRTGASILGVTGGNRLAGGSSSSVGMSAIRKRSFRR